MARNLLKLRRIKMFQDKLTRSIAEAASKIKTEAPKNIVNGNSVEGAVVSIMANEELKGNQHKIDANKNGKVDAHDFKLLRAGKKPEMKKEEVEMNEEDAYNKNRYAVKNGKTTGVKVMPESVELDESAGKITHYVAKKDLSNHKDYMDREGFDTHTRNLSKTHSLHKTHMGIMATDSPGEHGHHTEAGAQPASEYKKNVKALKKEEVEQIDELKTSTLLRYSTKANKALIGGDRSKEPKRIQGIQKAVSKIKDRHTVKEEYELDELSHDTLRSYVDKAKKENLPGKGGNRGVALLTPGTRDKGVHRAVDRMKKMKEETEQVKEAFPTVADAKKRMAAGQSSFEKKKISTGTVYSRKYKAEPDDADDMPKKKAKTMKEMLNIYKQHGAESLVENLLIEEPSQDEYEKEIAVAQAKAEGKIRNDKGIAKAASQGVKVEEVEIELLDADEINGVQIDNIEERSMTDAEMDKREEIVKGMKKGIQGFKDRYGKDAKSVMYATANKQSMKEQADESESEHYKAGHAYASDHAQDSGFKVTARARKKEMLADNPHKKGTPEHADWHRGALHGHQVGLDNM
jgi:hypothetical protein